MTKFCCTLLLVALPCSPRAEAPLPTESSPPERQIVVQVYSAEPYAAREGAEVFVLAENGTELAMAVTNWNGVARLTVPLQANSPQRFVFAEYQLTYITGLRWRPYQTKYLITLSGQEKE